MVNLKFNNAYISDWFSICSPDEEKGYIKNVDMYMKDYYYGENTAEKAELKMQKTVVNNLLQRNKFDLIIGGDLSNQLGTMNLTAKNYNKSFLGVYSACASFIESMLIGANLLSSKQLKSACLLTSSHILASERQFRFPNEYGSLKNCYSTTTITASVGSVISSTPTKYKIISGVIGNVVDYDIKDVANMGAIMAPAAAKSIYEHLQLNQRTIDDYDLILTGDLGKLGLEFLEYILKTEYNIMGFKNICDAGSSIYKEGQQKLMGGSGPSVIPFVFFNKILSNKKYKRILLVGTGALHNPTLVNQKNSIPAIAHTVEIEVTP